MSDTGLTPTGFVPDTIANIRAAIETDLRNTFGASLPLGDKTLLGHIVGILAEQIGLLWERAEQINSSQDPDKATDDPLDALCLLTGTFRQQALASTVPIILTGDDGTVVSAGKIIQTISTLKQFTTETDVTLLLQAIWVAAMPYSVFARVTNASRVYQCITAGTSAGSGGPTTTLDDITDGTVHWQYIGEGTAAFDGTARSVDTGPVVAVAGDFTNLSIQTPVAGWRYVKNIVDATLGANVQSDQQLRLTREGELAGSGASTRDAIRASLLKLLGVTSVVMFVNNTDLSDFSGASGQTFTAVAATDVCTATAHKLETGYGVQVSNSGGALPAGLSTGVTYFVIRIDANTFKLATSLANVAANIPINITTDGTGTQSLTTGLPPHAFESLVRGGVDQTIIDTIALEAPAGIATFGNTSGTHTDSEGNVATFYFSRPTNINMYARLSVNYDASLYPSDGDAEIKTAISVWGAGFPAGRDADPSAVGAQAFTVKGVLGVTESLIYTDVIGSPVAWAPTTAYVATVGARSVVTNDGRTYICITAGTSAGSGGPLGTGTNITDGTAHWYFLGNKIVIASRELASFDTSRTTVVSAAVAP